MLWHAGKFASTVQASLDRDGDRRSPGSLRDFIDRGFTAHHDVLEYWDSPGLKIFHGKVAMTFDDPAMTPVQPSMSHFFYMNADGNVARWIGAVGPTGF